MVYIQLFNSNHPGNLLDSDLMKDYVKTNLLQFVKLFLQGRIKKNGNTEIANTF